MIPKSTLSLKHFWWHRHMTHWQLWKSRRHQFIPIWYSIHIKNLYLKQVCQRNKVRTCVTSRTYIIKKKLRSKKYMRMVTIRINHNLEEILISELPCRWIHLAKWNKKSGRSHWFFKQTRPPIRINFSALTGYSLINKPLYSLWSMRVSSWSIKIIKPRSFMTWAWGLINVQHSYHPVTRYMWESTYSIALHLHRRRSCKRFRYPIWQYYTQASLLEQELEPRIDVRAFMRVDRLINLVRDHTLFPSRGSLNPCQSNFERFLNYVERVLFEHYLAI